MRLLALYSAADPVRADAPWDPLQVVLTAKELEPGVYAVLPHDAFTRDHVATTAGVVIPGVALAYTTQGEVGPG